MQPLRAIKSSNMGIAVISLIFLSTVLCPRQIWLPAAKADTIWTAFVSVKVSNEPQMHLPSIAITSPSSSTAIALTQAVKACANALLSSCDNTLPRASWDGMPFGTGNIYGASPAGFCRKTDSGIGVHSADYSGNDKEQNFIQRIA